MGVITRERTSLLTAGMGGRSGRSGTEVSFGSLGFHLGLGLGLGFGFGLGLGGRCASAQAFRRRAVACPRGVITRQQWPVVTVASGTTKRRGRHCQHAAALALVGVLDRVGLHLVRVRVRVRVRVSLTLA